MLIKSRGTKSNVCKRYKLNLNTQPMNLEQMNRSVEGIRRCYIIYIFKNVGAVGNIGVALLLAGWIMSQSVSKHLWSELLLGVLMVCNVMTRGTYDQHNV